MMLRSLRMRLFAAAAVCVAVALVVAGVVLTELFERHVTRQFDAELQSYLRQLSAAVEFGPDGKSGLGASWRMLASANRLAAFIGRSKKTRPALSSLHGRCGTRISPCPKTFWRAALSTAMCCQAPRGRSSACRSA